MTKTQRPAQLPLRDTYHYFPEMSLPQLLNRASARPMQKIWDEWTEGTREYRGYVIYDPAQREFRVYGNVRVRCPAWHYHHIGQPCPVCETPTTAFTVETEETQQTDMRLAKIKDRHGDIATSMTVPTAVATWLQDCAARSHQDRRLEINRTLVASTAHITQQDADRLNEETRGCLQTLIVYDKAEHGWRIYLRHGMGQSDRYSEAFWALCNLATEAGCEWLELDGGGPEIDGLPTFDW